MSVEFNQKKEQPKEQNETDAEISMKFLEEYQQLVRKYGRDFAQGEIHIVKVDFIK